MVPPSQRIQVLARICGTYQKKVADSLTGAADNVRSNVVTQTHHQKYGTKRIDHSHAVRPQPIRSSTN